jgi:hypothetical protein
MVGYLTGIELRRHWRGTLLLALLVALVVGTVIASVAGAGRSRTAMQRYLEEVRPFDAAAFGDPDARAGLHDLEGVAAAPEMELLAASFEIDPEGFYPLVVVEDGVAPYDYARFPVVDGRLSAPDAPRELMLGERTAERLGLTVGDTATLVTYTGDTARAVFMDGDGRNQPPPDGPDIDMTVVGIVRDPGDIGARESDLTLTFLTPAFREEYDGDEVGIIADGTILFLEPGASAKAITEAVEGEDVEIDTTFSATSVGAAVDPTMQAIATALYAFAGIVALAGLVAVAQSLARSQQAAGDDDHTLGALGVGRSARWARLAVPGVVAVVAGTAGGIALALAASPLFPVGLARRAEPDRGFDVDLPALVSGTAAALLLGGLLAVGLAARQVRRATVDASPRLGIVSRFAADAGAPSPVVSGLSLVSGTPGAPGRAAVGGVLVGAVGIIAALTFGASIDRLRGDPELYGWGWDLTIEGADLSHLPTDSFDPSVLLDDDDVVAAGTFVNQIPVSLDGHPEFAMAVHDVKGHLSPVVVAGRAPLEPDEVALAGDTIEQLDVGVGDEITVVASDREEAMRVTGVVALPVPEDGGSSATGAWFSQHAAERFGFDGACGESDSCTRAIAVRLRDGADPATIGARYRDDEAEVDIALPSPPGEIERLNAVQGLPGLLAAFLALLAAMAVSFAVATTLRRRRIDLAILRTLGMTARQLRTAVSALVLGLTAGGAILGTVLGVVVGRQVWQAVVDSVSMPFSPSIPVTALVLVPMGAMVLGHLVATTARHRAAATPAAQILRAE